MIRLSETPVLTRLGKAVDRLLSRIARHNTSFLLSVLCCVVALVGVFVIRDLRSANGEVNQMYTGSVHGLQRIASLQYDAQETRRLTLYALSTSDSNLQVQYADQSRAADQRVKDQIEDYARRSKSPAEAALGRRLRSDWSSYLAVRDDVVALILEGSAGEAVQLNLSRGAPAFDVVEHDLQDVVMLYDRDASNRLAAVVARSRSSSMRLVYILEFTLLLSAAGVWAIQRARLLSTLALSRLQMEFVASVSHELRTPLAVLRSAADNLADKVVRTPDDVSRYGLILQNQGHRMTQIVDDILLFASTEDRKYPYALQPIAITEIVASITDRTEHLLLDSGFSMEVRVAPDLPPVLGNLKAICQCLQNLIENATKYCRQSRDGVLRLSLCAAAGGSPGEIQFSITDHGPGIERSDLQRIFEPFYRCPSVIQAQIHGTGLGLALARRIAEAMQGSLVATSEINVGSTFTLTLPAAEPDSAQQFAAVEEDISAAS